MRKTTLLIILCLIIGLNCSLLSSAQELDIVDASPLFSIDLDKTPATRQKVYVSLIPGVIQYINNQANAARFEEEMTAYLKILDEDLRNNAGVIVKIRLYADEYGNNHLPQNFLIPLSVGLDPIDAYSEYLNTPSLIAAPIQTSAKEESYFLWITKTSGELTVSKIPKEFNSALIKQSSKMAMDKTREKSFTFNRFNSSIPNYISNANYWNSQMQTYKTQIEQNNRIAQVKLLTDKFEQLQKEHSQLIQEYESLKNKQNSNNSLLKMLETAFKIGSFISDNSSIFSGNSTTQKASYDPQIITNQNIKINNNLNVINKKIDDKSSELKRTDEALKTEYRRYNLM